MYKRFFYKTLLASSIFIILSFCIIIGFNEYFIRNIAFPEVEKTKPENKNLEKIEVIVLGDSHPAWGLEFNSENTLNIANTGNNYCINYYLFENYIKKGLRPKLAVIQFDYIQLSSSRDATDNYLGYINIIPGDVFRKTNFKWNINSILYVAGLKQFKKQYASNIFKMIYEYYFKNKKIENKAKQEDIKWSELNGNDNSLLIKTRIKDQFIGQNFSEFNYDYFIKIINLCKKYNITPVLVSFPVTEEYINAVPDSIKQEFDKKLNDFQLANIEYLDYMHIYKDNYGFFMDIDHLNKWGKKDLSDRLLKNLNYYSLLKSKNL